MFSGVEIFLHNYLNCLFSRLKKIMNDRLLIIIDIATPSMFSLNKYKIHENNKVQFFTLFIEGVN